MNEQHKAKAMHGSEMYCQHATHKYNSPYFVFCLLATMEIETMYDITSYAR